jgi:hypothetical protein
VVAQVLRRSFNRFFVLILGADSHTVSCAGNFTDECESNTKPNGNNNNNNNNNNNYSKNFKNFVLRPHDVHMRLGLRPRVGSQQQVLKSAPWT